MDCRQTDSLRSKGHQIFRETFRGENHVKMAEWAKKHGEVTVVAPKYEQSGKSHAIDFARRVEIKKLDLFEGCQTWCMDSTPADCVRFAMIGLEGKYDLVLSGINRGYNLGHDIAYSGTVGAACEATNFSMKAIALSTDVTTFDFAFEALDSVYEFIRSNRLFDHTDILNVNIPDEESKGFLITRRGNAFYSDQFVLQDDGSYMHIGEPIRENRNDLTHDIDAVINGYISVTPLTADRTDLRAYEAIKN